MKLFSAQAVARDLTVDFHIGTHKTGTTTIQEFLRLNKQRLRRERIVQVLDDTAVTDTRAQRAAHKIAETLWQGSRSPNWDRLRANVAGLRRDMPVLLSSEQMFRHLTSAKTAPRRQVLFDSIKAALGERVRFILYVRNFGDYFNSLVSERIIATTESRPIPEILGVLSHLAEIQQTAEHLQAAFGPDSVRLHSFDAAVRGEGGLLAHFARDLGWNDPDALEQPNARLHAMPPAQVLAAKYFLNGLGMQEALYVRLRRQIPQLVLRHGKSAPFRVISDGMVDSAIELGRRLNPDLGRFGDLPEALLYSDQAKSKPYVDLTGLPAERVQSALAEFYQLSTLENVKQLKIFD